MAERRLIQSEGFARVGKQTASYACALERPRPSKAKRFLLALAAFLLAPSPFKQPRRNRK